MKYIDMHSHIFPSGVAEKVIHALKSYYGSRWIRTGELDDLLRNLQYWIAPETFREFTAAFRVHPATPGKGEIKLTWINDGKPVETNRLNNSCRSADIKIPQPKNEFGLSFHSSPPRGVVVIAHPMFV